MNYKEVSYRTGPLRTKRSGGDKITVRRTGISHGSSLDLPKPIRTPFLDIFVFLVYNCWTCDSMCFKHLFSNDWGWCISRNGFH